MKNITLLANHIKFKGGKYPLNAEAVSSILKEASIIRTRLGTSPTWYNNIVYKCQNNTVTVSFIDSYLENMILPGVGIVIKYANEFFEYLFEGIVIDIKPGFPACITVQVNKGEELINTRTFPRYDTYLAAEIKPVWNESTYFSIVTNICLGGMAFDSKYLFDYGEECDVSIYISSGNSICTKGKVIRRIHKNSYFDYSMQFIEMDEMNNNKISNYILTLEQLWSDMKKHYFENVKHHLKTT